MKARDIARQARVEYEILGSARESLRLALDADLTPDTAAVWVDRVRFVFASYSRHMRRLLEFEEVGGHMAEVEKRRPTLAPQLERIRADHDWLREAVKRLEVEIQGAHETDMASLTVLRKNMGELLDVARAHESEEIEVIQEAFWQDIGGES